jgi:hypothetical protein
LQHSAPHHDANRLWRALIALLIGLCLVIGAAMTDVYFHRGVESGADVPTVVQSTGRELATNVDLTMFPTTQLEATAAALQTHGFRYVRQPFYWSAIEPPRGAFQWDTYDAIVDALNDHGLTTVAVLARSPAWARPPGTADFIDAPPANSADYADFVQEVVGRYGNRIEFVQLWDLPNNPQHWGGAVAKPIDYLNILSVGFNASRTANPETKVVLAAFDPANGDDLLFLRGIYESRGSGFFDIAAVQLDGGHHSPYDRTVSAATTNLSRAILFRTVMVDQGDVGKELWATRYGWNAAEDDGGVSRDQQADFMVSGLERARAEWPWMGLMFAWDFMPQEGAPGYALLTSNGTATPAFTALGDFAAGGHTGIAATGFIPMNSAPVTYDGNWEDQHLNRRTFRFTSEIGSTATLTFRGTGVIAVLRRSPQAGVVHASIDGKPLDGFPAASGTDDASAVTLEWFLQAENVPMQLASELDDGVHHLDLTLAGPGQLTIGGLVVTREVPFVWPVVTLAVAGGSLVLFALRELVYVMAMRAGYLQRRDGVELRPPLPVLPDWRPAPKA